MVIETKIVIGLFKLQLIKTLLVGISYNFECDWFFEVSDNKLSDNNLASELVGNHEESFKPISVKEIVIFMVIIVPNTANNNNNNRVLLLAVEVKRLGLK